MNRTNLYKIIKKRVSLVVISLIILLIFNEFFEKILALPEDFTFLHTNNVAWILLSVLLVPINWLLEVYKWNMLVNHVQLISFKDSLRSVLYGISFGIITPNRIGEFAGKLLLIEKSNRKIALIFGLYSSLIQQIITVIFGLSAAGIFIWRGELDFLKFNNEYFTYILLGALCIGTVAVLISKTYIREFLIKYVLGISSIWKVVKSTIGTMVLLSITRYIVFSLQYLFILNYFNINVFWMDSLLVICLIYFINSFIPSGLILGLGIRTGAAMLLFGYLDANLPAALIGTIAIWVINLFIPGIVGAFLLKDIKLPKFQLG